MRVLLLILIATTLAACGIDGPPTRPVPDLPATVDLPEDSPS